MSAEAEEAPASRKRVSRWQDADLPDARARTTTTVISSSSESNSGGSHPSKRPSFAPVKHEQQREEQATSSRKTGWQGLGADPAGPAAGSGAGNGNGGGSSQSSASTSSGRRGAEEEEEQIWGVSAPAPAAAAPKQLANFGLSGALSKDAAAGNVLNGVTLRWSEPLDAAAPGAGALWRLYVLKGGGKEPVETLHIHRQSAYLMGRDERVCDVVLSHSSVSKQHAVIQYRCVPVHTADALQQQWHDQTKRRAVKPYLMDLESANNTYLNGLPIDPSRYYELLPQDSIRFAGSSRDYVLMLA